MNSYTEKIARSDYEKVKTFFTRKNAELTEQQYAVFRTKTDNTSVILYESGKLVFQGPDVTNIVNEFFSYMGKNEQISTKPIAEITEPHIGVDESGKGDFFGPLVIAGVFSDENNSKKFIEAGIKDSKKLTDEKILKLANIIKANAPFSVVVIGNEKYNELYDKFKNLNKLLAWGHARVIENILEKTPCSFAISDQFGKDNLIKNALLEKGKNITLEQRFRGEEDIAVAAASVLARAEYVKRIDMLSARYEIEFPKGTSNLTLEKAKVFIEKYGKERLKEVAKLHFKTVNKI